MDLLMDDNQPESCSRLGLDCGTCMRNAASSVASICRGMNSEGLRQIFFQMYPSAGCRPMEHVFHATYWEATAALGEPVLATAAAA
jgi:hypothetical protein